MDSGSGSDYQNFVTGWLTFCVAFISFCCSLIILFLIYKLKRWNGYLLLVASLVTVQILFDISHILYVDPTYDACIAIRFFEVLSGLSVSIWTNIITFVAFYTAMYYRLVDIMKNYKYYLILAIGIPLTVSLLLVTQAHTIQTDEGGCNFSTTPFGEGLYSTYYFVRLFLIIANSTVVVFISLRLNSLKAFHKRVMEYEEQEVELRPSTSFSLFRRTNTNTSTTSADNQAYESNIVSASSTGVGANVRAREAGVSGEDGIGENDVDVGVSSNENSPLSTPTMSRKSAASQSSSPPTDTAPAASPSTKIKRRVKKFVMYEKQPNEVERDTAVISLVRRLKFYPLVQLTCRIVGIWNDWDRGNFGSWGSEILAAISNPFFGTGYLIVFLVSLLCSIEKLTVVG